MKNMKLWVFPTLLMTFWTVATAWTLAGAPT